jgi:hypothetical protein
MLRGGAAVLVLRWLIALYPAQPGSERLGNRVAEQFKAALLCHLNPGTQGTKDGA